MREFRVWALVITSGFVGAIACGGTHGPEPKEPTPPPPTSAAPEASAPVELDAAAEAADDADAAPPPPPEKVSVSFEDGPHPDGHALWLNTNASEQSVALAHLGPGQRCLVTQGKEAGKTLAYACGLDEKKRGTLKLENDTLTVVAEGQEMPMAARGRLDANLEVKENPPREACPEGTKAKPVSVSFDVIGGKLHLRVPSLKVDLEGGAVSQEQFCRTVVLAKHRVRLVCTQGSTGTTRELVLRGTTLYLTDSSSEGGVRSATEWGGRDVPCGSYLAGKALRKRGAKYTPSGAPCNAKCASAWTDCSEACHVKASDDEGELTDAGRACVSVCHTKFTACQQACSAAAP